MPHVKLGDNRIDIPQDTVAFLEQSLGSRELAAAAIRGGLDPGYYRQMTAAVQSGQLPQQVLDVAGQLARRGRPAAGLNRA